MRKAICNEGTGTVLNVIEIEENAAYELEDGKILIPATEDAEIGATWDGSTFARTLPPAPTTDELRTRALTEKLADESILLPELVELLRRERGL